MKSLHELVYEKLHIDKNSKLKTPLKIEPVDSNVERDIRVAMRESTPGKEVAHERKMKGYMEKGSKPSRLVNDIKDNKKLINRWFCAVKLEWDDAIQTFGEAVSQRCGFTQEQLHGYILKLYNELLNSRFPDMRDHCLHYLELYHIEHN